MTDQHRATPQQWETIEYWGRMPAESGGAIDSCLLELRARIEALEAAHREAPMTELRAASAEARPAGLVERVETRAGGDGRAAIREVAAALLEWHDSDQLVHTAWEAAKWLQREADR
jgi:hypothetical protein